MEVNFLYFIFVSYLIGSIPFAYILTKIFGYGDIRKIGSGNIGTTNVLRTGSKSLAIIVLLLDVFKGFLPIALFSLSYSNQFQQYEIIFLGSFSIIGHIFPVWLKFKGGKGVATYFGIILALSFKFGIIFAITWLLISFIFKYSSLASMIGTLIVFAYSIILENTTLSTFLFITFVIIFYTFLMVILLRAQL